MSATNPYDFYLKTTNDSPSIQRTLTDENDDAVDLSGATVRIHIADLEGVVEVDDTCGFATDGSDGVVVYNFAAAIATAGTYEVEFEVTYASGAVENYPNARNLTLRVSEALA